MNLMTNGTPAAHLHDRTDPPRRIAALPASWRDLGMIGAGILLGLAMGRGCVTVRRAPAPHAAQCPPCPKGQYCHQGTCVLNADAATAPLVAGGECPLQVQIMLGAP